MKKNTQFIGFIIILLLTYSAAAIGSIGTGSNVLSWYPSLNAPSFKPPNWLFGPVWAILYTLMALAAFRVWRKGSNTYGVKVSLFLYAVQLILNALWSLIFFLWHELGWALVEIIILELTIILTYFNFKRADKWAGYLLIPYILWVAFATILNGAFWWLN